MVTLAKPYNSGYRRRMVSRSGGIMTWRNSDTCRMHESLLGIQLIFFPLFLDKKLAEKNFITKANFGT